tara:strand:+ start:63 stop:323 length:261 start_codon:yes stop_codon:yes gene_type:complete
MTVMSELLMTIGEDLTVLVDYDYQPAESGDQETPPVPESVSINAVCLNNTDIVSLLSYMIIDDIEQNVFDSFNKELQEPEYEYEED